MEAVTDLLVLMLWWKRLLLNRPAKLLNAPFIVGKWSLVC